MNDKKFIKLYFFLSFFTFIIYSYAVLNFKSFYMNREYPMWQHVRDIIYTSSDHDFDVVMIGDSRAKAGFKPDIFDFEGVKSINLSVGGGTPIEGFYILKNFLKNNAFPDSIILSYAPFHLSYIDVFWDRTVKFNFLTTDELEEIVTTSRQLEGCSGVIGCEHQISDYVYHTQKYFIDFFSGIKNRNWSINEVILKDAVKTRGHAVFGTDARSDGLNKEAEAKSDFTLSKTLSYYLTKTVELAKDNGIKVYYYSMPFNKTSFTHTSPLIIDSYNSYIEKLCSELSVTCLNSLYYLPDDNFGDPEHVFEGIDDVSKDIQLRFQNANK